MNFGRDVLLWRENTRGLVSRLGDCKPGLTADD